MAGQVFYRHRSGERCPHAKPCGAGSWTYLVDVGRHPQTGRRSMKSKSGFRTKRAAEAALRRLLSEIDQGRDVLTRQPTVAEFAARWLEHHAANIRPATLARYRQLLAEAVGIIGHLQLDKVRPGDVQAVLDAMARRGLSARSRVQARAVLGAMFTQASRWEMLPSNPVRATRRPRTERPELVVPGAAQLAALCRTAAGTPWEPALLLAAETGARRGEVLGLRWADVDLDAGVVRILRTLQRLDGRLVFTDPKTARARRQVALRPAAVEALRRWRAKQAERRLLIGPAWVDLDLVCDRGDGGALGPDSFSHALSRLARQAGLPEGVRLHDLRHAVATVLLEQGVHPGVASAMLGHSSPAFTMLTYQHVTDNMAGKAAEALDRAFRAADVSRT